MILKEVVLFIVFAVVTAERNDATLLEGKIISKNKINTEIALKTNVVSVRENGKHVNIASIIHRSYMITSAKCVERILTSPTKFEVYYAYSKTTTSLNYGIGSTDKRFESDPAGRKREISGFDAGLIQLSQGFFVFEQPPSFICSVTKRRADKYNTADVISWRFSKPEQKKTCASNKVEEALRQIEVKILTRLNCAEQQEYSKNSFLIERMHDSLACIVPKNGKLEKVVDIGCPVAYGGILLGIVSYIPDESKGLPVVMTMLSEINLLTSTSCPKKSISNPFK